MKAKLRKSLTEELLEKAVMDGVLWKIDKACKLLGLATSLLPLGSQWNILPKRSFVITDSMSLSVVERPGICVAMPLYFLYGVSTRLRVILLCLGQY